MLVVHLGGGDRGIEHRRRLPARVGRPEHEYRRVHGTDPAPSLAQFQDHVAAGKSHYFIPGSTGGGAGGGTSTIGSQITTWVEAHYTGATVGGTTVYDLS